MEVMKYLLRSFLFLLLSLGLGDNLSAKVFPVADWNIVPNTGRDMSGSMQRMLHDIREMVERGEISSKE